MVSCYSLTIHVSPTLDKHLNVSSFNDRFSFFSFLFSFRSLCSLAFNTCQCSDFLRLTHTDLTLCPTIFFSRVLSPSFFQRLLLSLSVSISDILVSTGLLSLFLFLYLFLSLSVSPLVFLFSFSFLLPSSSPRLFLPHSLFPLCRLWPSCLLIIVLSSSSLSRLLPQCFPPLFSLLSSPLLVSLPSSFFFFFCGLLFFLCYPFFLLVSFVCLLLFALPLSLFLISFSYSLFQIVILAAPFLSFSFSYPISTIFSCLFFLPLCFSFPSVQLCHFFSPW